VNIKQLNEFEDNLVKFFRREMQTKIDPFNYNITELTTKVYVAEKQIARVALHDEVLKRLFEFYADLLDPEEFKRSGPSVTALDDLKVTTRTGSPSSIPFSVFNLTYRFRGFYGEMNVNIDVQKDFCMFFVIKHDTNFSENFGAFVNTQRDIFYVRILNRLDSSGSGGRTYRLTITFNRNEQLFIDITNNFKNKQFMIWVVKNGENINAEIAGMPGTITTTRSFPQPTSSKIHIEWGSQQTFMQLVEMLFTLW